MKDKKVQTEMFMNFYRILFDIQKRKYVCSILIQTSKKNELQALLMFFLESASGFYIQVTINPS